MRKTVKVLVSVRWSEHALAWKLRERSAVLTKIWCAPGNGAIADRRHLLRIEASDVDVPSVASRKNCAPDLTIIVRNCRWRRLKRRSAHATTLRWSPSQIAAQLEEARFSRSQFLTRHAIPTARPMASSHAGGRSFTPRWLTFPTRGGEGQIGLSAGKASS